MRDPVIIEYFSDILCVWAWIAQKRNDQLIKTYGADIEIHLHYVDVFGDVPTKMHKQWASKGSYNGFAQHVQQSAAEFEDVIVDSKIWSEIRPNTSANAHLLLKAIELAYDKETSTVMALQIRRAFFIDGQDIGNLVILFDILQSAELDCELVRSLINKGLAMAALMTDYQQSKLQNIKGSPSYVIDGGRQILYGNVGYRVLEANIKEHLEHSIEGASWC